MSTPSSASKSVTRDCVATCFREGMFAGEVVFVTGGTSGIGAATAVLFHALGAQVIAAGLGSSSAPFQACERLALMELDVTDKTSLQLAITELEQLDHLILCAGISLNAAETEIEGFRRVLEVNLIAAMSAAMAAAPLLAMRSGTMVTISSMYTFFGSADRPGYAASKGGIAQLTKSLAQLFAKDGVRVNSVAPGWIETPLARGLDAEAKASIKTRIPMKRWGGSEEIAAVIAFLCSPAASYITGAIVPVDGGYLVS